MACTRWHRIALCLFLLWFPTVGRAQQEDLVHELELIANDLLNSAVTAYGKGDYWKCARDLIVLVEFHPQYSQLDAAEVLLGNALFELGLYDAAKGTFQHVLERFPEKPSVSAALFGLERVAYKAGQYAEALGRFEQLKRRATAGSRVLEGGRYFAGLSLLEMEDYENALAVLSEVSPRSSYYGYALYTAAIACLRKHDVQQALQIFERLSVLPITGEESRAVVGEGRLTAGYVYYELGYYRRAMQKFWSVYPDHAKRQDALLAYAWAAYKAGIFREAVRGCTELITEFPETRYLEEALFLLGRSLMEDKRYDEAIRVFDRLIDLCGESPARVREEDRETLARLQKTLENLRLRLLVLESRLLQVLPGVNSSNATPQLRDRLEQIRERRTRMLQELEQERSEIEAVDRQVATLQRELEHIEGAPNWKAYAEYARARSLFLKTRS
ncbi:MAG: tetratricopeptide repeat protein [candidate division KSB1 bacterium]|nr:tetratricopeptide repeat protein [candidate division KSB1 bacterium]